MPGVLPVRRAIPGIISFFRWVIAMTDASVDIDAFSFNLHRLSGFEAAFGTGDGVKYSG